MGDFRAALDGADRRRGRRRFRDRGDRAVARFERRRASRADEGGGARRPHHDLDPDPAMRESGRRIDPQAFRRARIVANARQCARRRVGVVRGVHRDGAVVRLGARRAERLSHPHASRRHFAGDPGRRAGRLDRDIGCDGAALPCPGRRGKVARASACLPLLPAVAAGGRVDHRHRHRAYAVAGMGCRRGRPVPQRFGCSSAGFSDRHDRRRRRDRVGGLGKCQRLCSNGG